MGKRKQGATWEDLSPEEVKLLEGHVGPAWLPQWFCNLAAKYFKRLYRIECQQRHDLGYIIGGGAADRFASDLTLLAMMRRDSARQHGFKRRVANYISDLFFLAVRLFGLLSFNWREEPLSLGELRVVLAEKRRQLEEGEGFSVKNLAVLPACVVLALMVPLGGLALGCQSLMIVMRKLLMRIAARKKPTSPVEQTEEIGR